MQTSGVKTEGSRKSEWEDVLKIKDDKNKTQPVESVSVCDIWKYNLHRLVIKTEQQTPIYSQAYGQVYAEFLRCVDDLFDECCDWQKQYFDKLGLDQKSINAYGELYESCVDNISEFMDTYVNYKKLQADLIGGAMKIGNNYLCGWMDMYGKMMSFWNFQRER